MKTRKPLAFSWPITRERYRQVLAKMHRQWSRIQELELIISLPRSLREERLRTENETLKKKIEMYQGYYSHMCEMYEDLKNEMESSK